MYRITVKTKFSSAHHLRNYRGNCENVHGHNWEVLVTAKYKGLAENGIAIDFRELMEISKKIVDKLDHKDLNSMDYFIEHNPTSENIAKYIYDEIKQHGIPVESIAVAETDNYTATYSEDTD